MRGLRGPARDASARAGGDSGKFVGTSAGAVALVYWAFGQRMGACEIGSVIKTGV